MSGNKAGCSGCDSLHASSLKLLTPQFAEALPAIGVTVHNKGIGLGHCTLTRAQTIRQPRERLKGQPQERQHSDGEAGTRDRLPPARGAVHIARGIVTERPIRS